MQINQFNAGLNTRIAPHLIEKQFSRAFTNVNYRSGELRPIADKSLYNVANTDKAWAYYFQADQRWVSFANPTSFVEYGGVLYYADGIAPKKFKNNVANNLGIAPPTIQPDLVAVNGPKKIARCDINGLSGTGDFPANEKVVYIFVNRNASTGLFSKSDVYNYQLANGKNNSANIADAVELVNVGASFATSTDVYRQYLGVFRKVGTFTTSTGTVLDNIYDISSKAEIDDSSFISGTVQYGIVFYNSVDGSKSTPLITPEIVVADGKITINNIPQSNDSQVDKIQIYRIGGNLTTFTRVVTLNDGTLTYEDKLGDTALPGDLLDSANWDAAPGSIKYLTQAYGILFAADGNKLRFTPIGIPNAWPTLNYLLFPAPITGISVIASALLIHTLTETHIVEGQTPASFSQRLLIGDQGCLNHFSIVNRKGTAIWISGDGVCSSNGVSSNVLTKDRLDQQIFDSVKAVLYNEIYLLQLSDKRIFFLDFALDVIGYKQCDTTNVTIGLNRLFGFSVNHLYELEKSPTGILGFIYTSPDFISGSLCSKKNYKQFSARLKGSLTIEVFIDGVSANVSTFSNVAEDTYEMPLKKELTKGNKLNFTISGLGTVREIKFHEELVNE